MFEDDLTLGDLVQRKMREGRRRRSMSLRKASEKSGISAATLCRIRKGSTPDYDTLVKLCAWLNLEVSKFVEGRNIP